jgi:hypothetical protein
MFSSFFQYLLLAPSFINVLNVYAFSNLHDVSWGTKGSDQVDALPSVSSSKSKEASVVEDTARMQEDLDAAFKETVTRAVAKLQVDEKPDKPTPDDQNKTFRTRLVAFWLLTNGALAMAIQYIDGITLPVTTQDASAIFNACNSSNSTQFESCLDDKLTEHQDTVHTRQGIYFSVILYSTFAISAIRFVGVRARMIATFFSWLTHFASVCSIGSGGTSSGCAGALRLHNNTPILACTYHLAPRFLFAWTSIPMDAVTTLFDVLSATFAPSTLVVSLIYIVINFGILHQGVVSIPRRCAGLKLTVTGRLVRRR